MGVLGDFETAANALRGARRVVFFTGAGISVESGIPTYRDKLTGLWGTYDPQDLETAKAFRDNPALVWGFYLWRRYRNKDVATADQPDRLLPNPRAFGLNHLAPCSLLSSGHGYLMVRDFLTRVEYGIYFSD